MKIKILHIVLTLDVGGLENGVVNIINGLNNERFESVLCCIRHKGALANRLKDGVKVYELNHYKGVTFDSLNRLKRIIQDEKIDLVHSRNFEAYTFGFIAGKIFSRTPIVHSEHGRDFPFSRIKMLAQFLLSQFTDEIITVSDDLKRNIVKYLHVNEDLIRVIINGVDTEKFSPGEYDGEIAKEFNIKKSDIVIGTVGRLVEVKNYKELIYGFASIKKTAENAKLVFVGDGPMKQELKSLVDELHLVDSVVFTGKRDDVEKILRLFDIYALTSWNEGVSNTLLEAMSAALPVIASKVGGNVEVVKHEVVGLLYESGNREELSMSLDRLITDTCLRNQFANNARHHVLDNYSMNSMLINYSDVYSVVAGKNN